MLLSQFVDSLDFTRYEKEIILYLAEVDSADAKTIYKNTKVPQGRIYSVLNWLIEKSIVNIIPTVPKRYQIQNVKLALELYLKSKSSNLDQKVKEISELEIKSKRFILEKRAPSVYLFTGRDEHLQGIISLNENAKREILKIAPIFIGSFSSNLSLFKALQRGVKARIIIHSVTDKNRKKIVECLHLGAKIKVLSSPDLLSMMIVDQENFIVGVQNYHNDEERLTIYSKNKAVLRALTNTFEDLWHQAKLLTLKQLANQGKK